MAHPFPGMNPWLENPAIWRNVHYSLIAALRDELAPVLRPRYFVDIEAHTYIAVAPESPPATRFPDVAVINRGGPAVAIAEAPPPSRFLTVDLPAKEPVEEGYLEVRSVPDGEVVTVIELLSHTNKRPGPDRETYLEKREAILDLRVSFVEIDLLRAGPPMPYTEKADSHYRLFIRRSERMRRAHLYPFNVRESIPVFPLPLRPDDVEPQVDLGALLQSVYDRAGYDLIINYQQPSTPPLGDEDAAWAAALLGQAPAA